ncbi:MAG: 6-bladed beta-propeller [Desulfuromonadales bacterium]|nr:6-bladed beta-propeller [Desulfuromonadales bacterium]
MIVFKRFWPLLMVPMLFFVGCAKPKERIVFPLPPDTPRIEFIGVYWTQDSFEKTPFESFQRGILGTGQLATFVSPYGIVSNGRGVVYISDTQSRNLRVYDFNLKTVEYYFKEPVVSRPLGLALDSRERLYIADGQVGKVFVFGPERQPLFSFGTPEEITLPAYLAVNERLGRVYVSDAKGHRIVVYDLDGNYLFSFGQLGSGKGGFYAPQGLKFSADGELYVADQFNSLIQVFDAEGRFLRQFGERGDALSQFESPKDLAFDSDGNLYIIDGRRGHILTYTPQGKLLLVTGADSLTSSPLGFATPRSIHIDVNDRIYVSDMLNKRFSVWQYLSDAYLEKHPLKEEDLEAILNKVQK